MLGPKAKGNQHGATSQRWEKAESAGRGRHQQERCAALSDLRAAHEEMAPGERRTEGQFSAPRRTSLGERREWHGERPQCGEPAGRCQWNATLQANTFIYMAREYTASERR
jgi:hypothetical protein